VSAGLLVGELAGVHELGESVPFLLLATALLAIGLYGSTYGIDNAEVRQNAGVVIRAVTVGVVLKSGLIAGVMYAVFRDPAYIVIGVAVAQIDPLSVAVMRHRVRLSERAKAILSAWSSFDDPVTAILAVMLASAAAAMGTVDGGGTGGGVVLGGVAGVGVGLVGNAVVLGVLAAIWFGLRRISARTPGRDPDRAAGNADRGGLSRRLALLAVVVLVAVAAVAVYWVLLLGLAAAGLFYRPGLAAVLNRLVAVAFWVALVMLGLVLADGVRWWPGLVLGFAAFGAQVVVGGLLTRSLPADRARLSFSQQNGITAVILALLLENVFPGTVAVVAPAVLVVNVLHLVSNRVLDAVADGTSRWSPSPAPNRVWQHPAASRITRETR